MGSAQFGNVKFEITTWHQSKDDKKVIGYMRLEFMRSGLKIQIWEFVST